MRNSNPSTNSECPRVGNGESSLLQRRLWCVDYGGSGESGHPPALNQNDEHPVVLTRIHRRYDVAAAEWVMRGKGRRWSGHDSGKWGRCLSSAAAGRPRDRLGTLGRARWRGEGRGERCSRTGLARVCGDVRLGGWRVSCGRAPSGWEWNRSQPCQGATELGFPRPALWQMQGEAACRAGEPSGQGEEPSPKGLGGRDLLAQTDPRRPAGQVVGHHLYRHPKRRWRRSGRTACGSDRRRT